MSNWLLIGFTSLVSALLYFLLSPNWVFFGFIAEGFWIGGTAGLLFLSVTGFSFHFGRTYNWSYRERFVIGFGLMVGFVLLFCFILWWVVANNINHI